jgi:hypothetical protein
MLSISRDRMLIADCDFGLREEVFPPAIFNSFIKEAKLAASAVGLHTT